MKMMVDSMETKESLVSKMADAVTKAFQKIKGLFEYRKSSCVHVYRETKCNIVIVDGDGHIQMDEETGLEKRIKGILLRCIRCGKESARMA